jgi:phage gp16-like protein
MVAKIRALLINDAGGPLPDTYADAIARQMFKVERFEWCTPEQLHKIVQALEVKKRDRVRAKKAEAKISS